MCSWKTLRILEGSAGPDIAPGEDLVAALMSGAVPGSAWKKSSYSNSGGCVEVAHADGWMLLRDSKDPGGPQLSFNVREWRAFLNGVRANEFEWPTE